MDHYWNPAGPANWTDANVWAATDGGTPNLSAPTNADNVFFTATNNNACTTSGLNKCKNLNFGNYAGTFTNTSTFSAYGNVTFSPYMTYTNTAGASNFDMFSPTPVTIQFNGISIGNSWNFEAAGSVTMLDNGGTTLSCQVKIVVGSLITNGHNLTTSRLSLSAGTSIDLGSGSHFLSFQLNVSTSATVIPGTSTIFLVSQTTGNTFSGGNQTYYNVVITDSSFNRSWIISGNNSFNNFTITNASGATCTVSFTDGSTNTFTSFNATGAAGSPIVIQGTGTAGYTIKKVTGGVNYAVVSCDYCTISYCTATGILPCWYAGANSTDGGNNSGWVFSVPTGNGNSGFF